MCNRLNRSEFYENIKAKSEDALNFLWIEWLAFGELGKGDNLRKKVIEFNKNRTKGKQIDYAWLVYKRSVMRPLEVFYIICI